MIRTIRDDENYIHLKQHYERMPLALYVGAGASNAGKHPYGIGGWSDLLDNVATAQLGPTEAAEYRAEAEKLEPWDQAQRLADRVDQKAIQQEIVRQVRRKGNFQDSYKGLLTSAFLNSAGTLRALAAFCAELVGFSVGKGPAFYGRVQPNRRVPAVVSTNYDPYLEAAASLMFRTLTREYLLKPVGATGSKAGSQGQIPVFHVHGYVAPQHGKAGNDPVPFVDPVLTRADYKAAWEDTGYSHTIGPQVHVLRHYSALFVGFSFRDEWVNNLLKDLEVERQPRGEERLFHYALVPSATLDERGLNWFAQRGVKPIRWDHPGQIIDLFGDLYCAGIHHAASQLGGINLVEFETRSKTVRPSGSPVRLDPSDAAFCWESLLGSRLGRMPAAPPRWRGG